MLLRAFTTRQQNLAGIAPQVAGQDALQQQAQTLAQQGIGSFQPFLQSAQAQAALASGLGTAALGQLGTGGTLGTAAQTLAGHTYRCNYSCTNGQQYVPLSITSN